MLGLDGPIKIEHEGKTVKLVLHPDERMELTVDNQTLDFKGFNDALKKEPTQIV
jgi:hypothetical protein